jgi:hypothetical protein
VRDLCNYRASRGKRMILFVVTYSKTVLVYFVKRLFPLNTMEEGSAPMVEEATAIDNEALMWAGCNRPVIGAEVTAM